MTKLSAADVREWARNVGMPVATRGRLSPAVVAAYLDAQAERDEAARREGGTGRRRGRGRGRGKADDGVAIMEASAGGRTVRAKPHWDWERREADIDARR